MKLIKTKLDGMELWYDIRDRFVGERIAMGKYETYETKLLLSQINKDSVVIDVGANIGYYTVLMAKKGKKVYAIEPETRNFEILKKNVEVNNLKNVVLINAAAGDTNDFVWLKKSSDNFGDHRLTTKDCRVANTPRNDVRVKCVRLDDLMINEQKIDLIKSDTQGWEPAVIAGARKIIERDSPTLFLEYWPEGASEGGQNLKAMMYELRKMYNNIWHIDDELNTYKKASEEIVVNEKTGYADLWMKKETALIDWINCYRNIKIKKLIKQLLRVK